MHYEIGSIEHENFGFLTKLVDFCWIGYHIWLKSTQPDPYTPLTKSTIFSKCEN